MKTISVTQLHERLAAGTITVVDVREDDELALARIDSAVHMPLHQLPQRFSELDPQAPIALLCHHGMRSEMAARFLEKNGYGDIANRSEEHTSELQSLMRISNAVLCLKKKIK